MPHKDPEAKRAYDRAYKKAWRQANSVQKRAETRAWRQANPERTRELNRLQKLRDRAKIQQRAKARYHALREINPALFEARAAQARIRSRAHYDANRAAKIAYQQTYAQLHADTILPRHRAYYPTSLVKPRRSGRGYKSVGLKGQQVCSGFFPRLSNVCALFQFGLTWYTLCIVSCFEADEKVSRQTVYPRA